MRGRSLLSIKFFSILIIYFLPKSGNSWKPRMGSLMYPSLLLEQRIINCRRPARLSEGILPFLFKKREIRHQSVYIYFLRTKKGIAYQLVFWHVPTLLTKSAKVVKQCFQLVCLPVCCYLQMYYKKFNSSKDSHINILQLINFICKHIKICQGSLLTTRNICSALNYLLGLRSDKWWKARMGYLFLKKNYLEDISPFFDF